MKKRAFQLFQDWIPAGLRNTSLKFLLLKGCRGPQTKLT
jgi:hypothetical protein